MKSSKAKIRAKFHKIPAPRFSSDHHLTSYSGLVLVQALFMKLKLKDRLRQLLSGGKHAIYGLPSLIMLLVVLVMLGFRRLRELDYCRDDPMLTRVTGLRQIPNVSTVSRQLAKLTEQEIRALREKLLGELVLDRLALEKFARVTVDFDGSVQSTCGHAEGTAVGFNRKKKGARSYYPLFATLAQLDQFFDMHHRPGNVHDSNGAADFMSACFFRLCQRLPHAQLETRIDSAFFNELVFMTLEEYDVDFTCSVPFERFPELKERIETRKRWRRVNKDLATFETTWKPKSWDKSYRLVFVRKRRPVRHRGPLQLDLFVPRDFEYEYTAIATNRTTSAKNIVLFHHGRGSQEKLLGQAKQHAALDVIVGKRLVTNQAFTLVSMLAHNLSREMQIAASSPQRATLPSRAARWMFHSLGTIRHRYFHRAGKLSRPQGQLTLTMNENRAFAPQFCELLDALAR